MVLSLVAQQYRKRLEALSAIEVETRCIENVNKENAACHARCIAVESGCLVVRVKVHQWTRGVQGKHNVSGGDHA
jgi:hypothetical protein